MTLAKKTIYALGTLLLTATLSAPSPACSIYEGSPEEIKAQIIPRLAAELAVAVTAIRPENLTRPGISFLAGLGADCSGLDQAIRTSAYSFTVTKGRFQRCEYKGVAIFKGIDVLTAPLFLNAEEVRCAPIFHPLPPQ